MLNILPLAVTCKCCKRIVLAVEYKNTGRRIFKEELEQLLGLAEQLVHFSLLFGLLFLWSILRDMLELVDVNLLAAHRTVCSPLQARQNTVHTKHTATTRSERGSSVGWILLANGTILNLRKTLLESLELLLNGVNLRLETAESNRLCLRRGIIHTLLERLCLLKTLQLLLTLRCKGVHEIHILI